MALANGLRFVFTCFQAILDEFLRIFRSQSAYSEYSEYFTHWGIHGNFRSLGFKLSDFQRISRGYLLNSTWWSWSKSIHLRSVQWGEFHKDIGIIATRRSTERFRYEIYAKWLRQMQRWPELISVKFKLWIEFNSSLRSLVGPKLLV